MSTGLKWSVLTTHVWTDMMEELRIYVKEKVRSHTQIHIHIYHPSQFRLETRICLLLELNIYRFVVVYLKPFLRIYRSA
jgi:hypothetical protein